MVELSPSVELGCVELTRLYCIWMKEKEENFIESYAIVWKKGYQDVDVAESAVTSKVKGVVYTNYSDDEFHHLVANTSLYRRIWDVADFVVPPMRSQQGSPLQGYGGTVFVLMLELSAKASMLGTASNYRQSQTFTKVCLDHGAMINESCTPIPHSIGIRVIFTQGDKKQQQYSRTKLPVKVQHQVAEPLERGVFFSFLGEFLVSKNSLKHKR
ncbi:P2RX1 [Cordylochernes scorpioides]|uniref:P2RX1 n=1 Tax=Cordylochernes scorpioides TaxID=51811 RepID=A0ABY6K267_9ARAC|nr:P2RX1 [Cordylochernes scorpioides]